MKKKIIIKMRNSMKYVRIQTRELGKSIIIKYANNMPKMFARIKKMKNMRI